MKNHKRGISLLCAALLLSVIALPALAMEGASTSVIEGILNAQALKTYTDEAVSQEDLDQILTAGAKAPSARNLQPWRFIVVKNTEMASQLSGNNGVVIVITGLQDAGEGMNVDFDCGLATQNMYLAAQSLGLGANIALSPVSKANDMAETLGMEEGYAAVMVMTLGHVAADAVSEPTARNAVSDMTTYVE